MVANVAGVGVVPVVCPNASVAPSTSRDAVAMVWFNRSLFISCGMHWRVARSTGSRRLYVLNRELAKVFTPKNGTLLLFQNRQRVDDGRPPGRQICRDQGGN